MSKTVKIQAKEKGVSHKLSEAWKARDFYVEYNGCELEPTDFVEFEAVFGNPEINAILMFLDRAGFTTGTEENGSDPKVGGFVKVGYTDPLGCSIVNEYVITKITIEKDKKEQPLVKVDMVDKITMKAKTDYTASGHPNKKYSEVIEERTKELDEEGRVIIIPPEHEDSLNIVIGSDESYYDTLTKTCEDRQYEIRTDRKYTYIIHKEHTEFDKLMTKMEEFDYDTHHMAINRIIQYRIDGYDINSYLDSIPTVVQNDGDPRTLNAIENKNGIVREQDKTTPKDIIPQGPIGKGARHTVKAGAEKEYYTSLKNANKMSIWVPGRNIERIGTKVKVNFPKPKFYKDKSDDNVFSGEYEVINVRDKFINHYFVQELFLRRPIPQEG